MSEILIVEDSESDARLLERVLRTAGIANPIHHVWNADEAILYLADAEKRFQSGPPPRAVIFLDLKLPGESGFEILTLLKGRQVFANTLKLVVSQLDDLNNIKQAYALGAHSFLPKPVKQEDFSELIRAFPEYWQVLPRLESDPVRQGRSPEAPQLPVDFGATLRRNREIIQTLRSNLQALRNQVSDQEETFAIIDTLLDDLRENMRSPRRT